MAIGRGCNSLRPLNPHVPSGPRCDEHPYAICGAVIFSGSLKLRKQEGAYSLRCISLNCNALHA